jgi:hypothetical protein|tara:strand:+ start:670 stop:876 length:207 start_codon:yes stop_codon:yes gene_type:complete
MDKLLKFYKTQTALAAALNAFLGTNTIKTGHIYYWLRNGLPASRALQIEAMTDGLFDRRLLCPKFFNQ